MRRGRKNKSKGEKDRPKARRKEGKKDRIKKQK
jgi:hypothetical protein